MLISHLRIGKPSTSGGSSLVVVVSRFVWRVRWFRDDLRDSLSGHELDSAFNLIAVSASLALERHVGGEQYGRLEK